MNELTPEEITEGLNDFFRRNVAYLQNHPPRVGKVRVETDTQQFGESKPRQEFIPDEPYLVVPQQKAASPRVDSVDPTHGPADGFNQVEIYGSGFTPSSIVTFDQGGPGEDSELVLFVSDDGTHISVQVDEHDPSDTAVDVTVRNGVNPGELENTLPEAYTFDFRPNIVSLSPTSGSFLGGTTVTLQGSHFGGDAMEVFFGGVAATAVDVFDEGRQCICVTPANVVGLVDVRVRNPDGQEDTLPDSFTYTGVVPVGFMDCDPHDLDSGVIYSVGVRALTSLGGSLVDYTGTCTLSIVDDNGVIIGTVPSPGGTIEFVHGISSFEIQAVDPSGGGGSITIFQMGFSDAIAGFSIVTVFEVFTP